MIGAATSFGNSSSLAARQVDLNSLTTPVQPPELTTEQLAEKAEAKELFNRWVGMTFYGQLLGEMRKSVGKSAYFNGGRAEEVFQGQLDLQMAEQMADASADTFSGPMYELTMLSRPR
ncbi:MAG: rod-binding protein [Pirellulaceae bacterium]